MKLSEVIAKHFQDIHLYLKNQTYTHFWLSGGRMSTKSSFISLEIIFNIMKDKNANAVVLRKTGETLQDSVYSQLIWAIEKLGVQDYWDCKISPLKLIYKPTGQQIIFRSVNNKEDYKKIKSTKFIKGYCKYIWYEELDEFNGMEEIRSINQSLMRGGDIYNVFYSYNPPKSVNSWVNAEKLVVRSDRITHHSTYLDVPKEWLGKQSILEAEHLKQVNEQAYKHEYLGEATGTGGAIFDNILVKEIKDEDIKIFDNIQEGIDFGYSIDPAVHVKMHYDKTRRRLYIYDEIYKVGLSNKELYEEIKKKQITNNLITCDSAEPKSIDELKSYGLRCIPAKKGPDSRKYGIKFLQKIEKIIIDPAKCPNTTREFSTWEYEKDKYGNFKSKYPEINDHTIDATRYALEKYTKNNTWQMSGGRIL